MQSAEPQSLHVPRACAGIVVCLALCFGSAVVALRMQPQHGIADRTTQMHALIHARLIPPRPGHGQRPAGDARQRDRGVGKDTPLPRDTGALDLASKTVFPGKYRAPASID